MIDIDMKTVKGMKEVIELLRLNYFNTSIEGEELADMLEILDDRIKAIEENLDRHGIY